MMRLPVPEDAPGPAAKAAAGDAAAGATGLWPAPADAFGPDDPFHDAATQARARGGFARATARHALIHIPPAHRPANPAARRLVVAFDNLHSPRADGPRWPWGHGMLDRQGWDVLGVMARVGDFFREDGLFDALEGLRDAGFFGGFPAVSLYGSSMGGYAAAAFAPLAPGCTVVAFAPQSTLVRRLAPFDGRYRQARRTWPWRGRWLDAAEGIGAAGRAFLFFDPRQRTDRLHVARLVAAAPGIARPMPSPLMSHQLPPALLRLRLLRAVSLAALTGDLTPAGYARMIRVRRDDPAHVLRVAQAAAARHPRLALRLLDARIAAWPDRASGLRALRRRIAARLAGPRP